MEDEFAAFLECGLLEHGFLRVRCDSCQAEKLVAFSCKRSGFCPSCGARRMAETAALLVDEVLPREPIRQWVLSVPFALRYLLATRLEVVTHESEFFDSLIRRLSASAYPNGTRTWMDARIVAAFLRTLCALADVSRNSMTAVIHL